jgi:hypothetical protein
MAEAAAPADAAPSAPVVQFRHPLNGHHLSGSVLIQLEVSHTAPVTQVSVLADGAVVGIDLAPPFEILWNTGSASDGPHTLVAKARDEEFREGSVRIAVTVDNTPPTVGWVGPPDGAIAVATIRLEARASDVIGLQGVKFLINGEPVHEAAAAPFAFDWDTAQRPNGRYGLQARASDKAGNGVTSPPIFVRVANFNRSPELHPIGDKIVAEGEPLMFEVEGTDPDGARDPLTYHAANLPSWAAFDPAARRVSGIPALTEASIEKNQAVYRNIRFEVCDPEPLCDQEAITITVIDVNRPPVVDDPGDKTVKEGESLAFKVGAYDPDGDPLTCRAIRLPRWAALNTSTCTVRGIPGFDIATLDEPVIVSTNVQVEYCDTKPACTLSHAFTISVTNVNGAPAFDPIEPQAAEEGRVLEISLRAVDPDGDRPYLKAVLPDGAKLYDYGDGRGRVTWTPRSDQAGRHDVTLVATDRDLSETMIVPVVVRERSLAVSGLILDEKDRPVEGVVVRLTTQARTARSGKTDAHGAYLVDGLLPGDYTVRPDLDLGRVIDGREKTAVFSPPLQRVTIGERDERGVDFLVSFE